MTGTKAPLMFLAAASLLALAGCSPSLVQTDPKLPPGFLDARVPASDLSAYMYMSQEQPITIPLDRFGDPAHAANNPRFATIPEKLAANRLALSVGPTLDSFGGVIEFESAARGFYSDIQAEIAEIVASGHPEVTVWRGDKELFLVRGTGGWADAMSSALRSGEGAPFKDMYPDIWELMRLLPESPPAKPVAAGFLKPTKVVIDALASRAGLDLGTLSQAMGTVNIKNVAFIAYSDRPVAIPTDVTPEYIRRHNVGAIYVARSSYPGFILSFFLNNFSGRIALEKVTIRDETVLYRAFDDVHLLVKAIGSTIFFTMAPERAFAEELMASVLDVQAG